MALGGGVVHEVVSRVGLVGGGVHQEGARGAQRNDGVHGSQGQRQDRGRVIARERHDLAFGAEPEPAHVVRRDGAHAAAAVHAHLAELAVQRRHPFFAARRQLQ